MEQKDSTGKVVYKTLTQLEQQEKQRMTQRSSIAMHTLHNDRPPQSIDDTLHNRQTDCLSALEIHTHLDSTSNTHSQVHQMCKASPASSTKQGGDRRSRQALPRK